MLAGSPCPDGLCGMIMENLLLVELVGLIVSYRHAVLNNGYGMVCVCLKLDRIGEITTIIYIAVTVTHSCFILVLVALSLLV